MDMTPAATALRHALHQLAIERWTQLDECQRDTLQRLVCETVDECKANSWPPEKVVIRLRQIAHDAGFRPALEVMGVPSTIFAREHLLTEIVRWSMDHYFNDPV
jgi:hypothetical protein